MELEGFFAFELHIGFQELERYLEITEKYLQKAKNDFENHIEEQRKNLSTANLSPQELEEINEFYNEEHWDYSETFPRILRSSFFVSAYSLFESKMATICNQLKKDKELPISWSDLKGDTLDQFKTYCKLAGLKLSNNIQGWQEIQHYALVRNCVVHNRGLIDGAKHERELRSYISKKNIVQDIMLGLSVRPKPQIALTEEFCKESTKTIWAFLEDVLKSYESQRQELKAAV